MSKVYTEPALAALAHQIAGTLQPGDNIYLSGELGTGKTTFARYLLEALNSPTAVSSPTFQLIDEHVLPDNRLVAHLDLYRLTTPDDLYTSGVMTYVNDPNTISVVEWPERGEQLLPTPKHHLHLSHRDEQSRHLTIESK